MSENRLQTRARRAWLFVICLSFTVCLLASAAPAQDDMLRLIETKRLEQKDREEALKHEEQRLNIIRTQVDERIEAYSKLLVKVEAAVKILEQARGEKIDGVVKAYEVMSPEDAAAKLSTLDNNTIYQIMTRMKSKKAGAIIALMNPQKAAALTRKMAAIPVNPRRQ